MARIPQLSMAWKVVAGALVRRRIRTAVALLSVVVGASVTGAMVSVARDADRKVGQQLRGYGPNLVVVPKAAGTVPEALAAPRQGVVWAVPYRYLVGQVADQDVVLVGTRRSDARRQNPWWRIAAGSAGSGATRAPAGTAPSVAPAWVGEKAAKVLHLAPGAAFTVDLPGGRHLALRDDGTLSAGGDEDAQVVIDLANLPPAPGGPLGGVSLVALTVDGDLAQVRRTGANLTAGHPDLDARPVLAVAASQAPLLAKVRGLMLLVTLVIVACSALCTGATLAASAAEREREFGLMKALGASRRRLAGLFLGEALLLGLIGGLVGYGIGLGFAQAIGKSLGDGWVAPDPAGFAAALGVAIALTAGAGVLGLARALAVDPLVTLKGE